MAVPIVSTALYNDANLQGYWRLEDGYIDESGNGYTLSPSGSPTFVTGQFQKALNLVNTSSQYANNAAAACRITGSQTFICWIKPTGLGTAFRAIMGVSQADTANRVYLGHGVASA